LASLDGDTAGYHIIFSVRRHNAIGGNSGYRGLGKQASISETLLEAGISGMDASVLFSNNGINAPLLLDTPSELSNSMSLG
jgi:hypothetical protein